MTWHDATTTPPVSREIVWTIHADDRTPTLGWREGDRWYGSCDGEPDPWDDCDGGKGLLWHRVSGENLPAPPRPKPAPPKGWVWTTHEGGDALRHNSGGAVWWVRSGCLCGASGWACPVDVARALLALEGS